MKTIVVVDDEVNARQFVRNIIAREIDGFEVIGEASSIKEAVEVISEKQPDILLLDIHLEDGLSFEIFDYIRFQQYTNVFITSYDHYAIKAIKMAAFDYILKPIDIEEFVETLEKVKHAPMIFTNEKDSLKEIMEQSSNSIYIQHQGKHIRLRFVDIYALVSDGSYSTIILENTSYYTSYPVSHYEQLLPEYFFKAHRSVIANCSKVKSIETGRGGSFTLQNNITLSVATRRKSEFVSHVNTYS
ncbi:MAG: response regulator [Bacteroidia bacterium]|nr:response regulator [Bacteroidia bacterium]